MEHWSNTNNGKKYWDKEFVSRFWDYCDKNSMYHTWDGIVIDRGSQKYICVEDCNGERSYVCGRAKIDFDVNWYEGRAEVRIYPVPYKDMARAMVIKRGGYTTSASRVAGRVNNAFEIRDNDPDFEGEEIDILHFSNQENGIWDGDICSFPDGSRLQWFEDHAEEIFD